MSFLFILVAMSKIYQINNKRWGSDCYILPNTIQVIWKFLRESDKQRKCTIVLWRLNIWSWEPKLGEIVAGEKITSERLRMVRFKIYRFHELQILSHFTLYWRVTRKVVSNRNGGYFQHANVAKYEFSIICVCKDLSRSNSLKRNQYSDFCRYILRLIVVLNIDFLSSQRCEAGLHLGISRANLLNHSTLKY